MNQNKGNQRGQGRGKSDRKEAPRPATAWGASASTTSAPSSFLTPVLTPVTQPQAPPPSSSGGPTIVNNSRKKDFDGVKMNSAQNLTSRPTTAPTAPSVTATDRISYEKQVATAASQPTADERTGKLGRLGTGLQDELVAQFPPRLVTPASASVLPYIPATTDIEEETGVPHEGLLVGINNDLGRYLRMNHVAFWAHVLHDSAAHLLAFIDSFLRYSPRPFDLPTDGPQPVRTKMEAELHRRAFLILYRLSKPSEGESRMSEAAFVHVVRDLQIWTVPKLLDLCALYAPSNGQLVREIVERIFTSVPALFEDLVQAAAPALCSALDTVCGLSTQQQPAVSVKDDGKGKGKAPEPQPVDPFAPTAAPTYGGGGGSGSGSGSSGLNLRRGVAQKAGGVTAYVPPPQEVGGGGSSSSSGKAPATSTSRSTQSSHSAPSSIHFSFPTTVQASRDLAAYLHDVTSTLVCLLSAFPLAACPLLLANKAYLLHTLAFAYEVVIPALARSLQRLVSDNDDEEDPIVFFASESARKGFASASGNILRLLDQTLKSCYVQPIDASSTAGARGGQASSRKVFSLAASGKLVSASAAPTSEEKKTSLGNPQTYAVLERLCGWEGKGAPALAHDLHELLSSLTASTAERLKQRPELSAQLQVGEEAGSGKVLFDFDRAFKFSSSVLRKWLSEGNAAFPASDLEFLVIVFENLEVTFSQQKVLPTRPSQPIGGGSSSSAPSAAPPASSAQGIAQVKEIFPDLGDGFILACLKHYNGNAERVVQNLFEDSLPADLKALDRSMPIPQAPAQQSGAAASSKAPAQTFLQPVTTPVAPPQDGPSAAAGGGSSSSSSLLASRRNVYDGDEFDVFKKGASVDTNRVHVGKKAPEVSADAEVRSRVLERVRRIEYEDEFDDSFDAYNEYNIGEGEQHEQDESDDEINLFAAQHSQEFDLDENPALVSNPCDFCGLPSLYACPNCSAAFYCSHECVKRDWNRKHKFHCGEEIEKEDKGTKQQGAQGKAEITDRKDQKFRHENKAAIGNHHRKDRSMKKMMRSLGGGGGF